MVVAWTLECGEIDCKEAPFGEIEIFEILVRIVVICEDSFNGALKYTFSYM